MLKLRPYKDSDAETVAGWLSDEEGFWKWCAGQYKRYPALPEDIRGFYREQQADPGFFEMTALEGVKVVGHLVMRYLDPEQTDLKFGFIIVDPSVRGKGYGRQMLTLALRYAFEILRAERVSLGVFENNPAAARCYEGLGFCRTGRYTVHHLMEEDWKFWEMEYRKEEAV
ncbi:MAG: GNAT family protein [Eubacteriales bacterium]|nr:GNAT family protein [Eubacteriales bacterium]